MKSLQTIQKTSRVFQILTKISMILTFVWAGLTLIGLLCGAVWYSGGTVVGASRELVLGLTHTEGTLQMMGVLLADLAFALADGILLVFAYLYFKAEQAAGTPFTHSGADQIRRLGIRTIVLPLVAVILASVAYELLGVPQAIRMDGGNLSSVSMGIVLILASLIFHYGADLVETKSA